MMDLLWRKRRRVFLRRSRSSFTLCLIAPMVCLLLLLGLRLPKAPLDFRSRSKGGIEGSGLGRLGEMMVEMLPDDLAFTVFVPSEDAFERSLRLRASESLAEEEMNNTYAIVSRVMGFSAVPRQLPSQAVVPRRGEEACLDSISGFRLNIWKDVNQKLVVNGVESEMTDLRKGEIIIHKMAGVIMDADFRRSFPPDDDRER